MCAYVCMCVQERESLLRPQSAWYSYNHKASAMDTVMGILPQALLCGFSNKYLHSYSSSSLILWLQQLMPSWVFVLKPYFAASIMHTVMGILSSSSLILQLQQWIPSWVFILPQTLFGITAQAHLVYLVSAICLVTKGQERRASTKQHFCCTPTIDRELMKSVGACHSSSSQLLVMNVKVTSALQQADGSWWNRNRETSTDE